MPSRSVRLSNRLYQAALCAYPRGFRQRFGEPMAKVFEETCDAAFVERGLLGVLGLWPVAILDLAGAAAAEHLSRYGAAVLKSRWTAAFVTAALACAGSACFGGSGFLYLWGWLLALPLASAVSECVQRVKRRFPGRVMESLGGAQAALALCCVFDNFFLFALAIVLPKLVENPVLASAGSWGILPICALMLGTLPFFRQENTGVLVRVTE